MALPDFLIIGSPKCGSTALHVALVPHPDLFLSNPKEPKFFMCDGRKPDPGAPERSGRRAQRAGMGLGPGRLREAVRPRPRPGRCGARARRSTSGTPTAHRRIHALIPDVKMIAVIRDPIDRAYSNWGHLWCDGLEPEADFLTACRQEPHADRRGLRAVLALPGDGTVRPATRAPVRRLPARTGLCAALPAAHRQHRGGAGRDHRFPRRADRSGPDHSRSNVKLGAGHAGQPAPAVRRPGGGGRRRTSCRPRSGGKEKRCPAALQRGDHKRPTLPVEQRARHCCPTSRPTTPC